MGSRISAKEQDESGWMTWHVWETKPTLVNACIGVGEAMTARINKMLVLYVTKVKQTLSNIS